MIDFVTDVDPQSRPKAEKQTPAFPGGKIKMFFDSKTHKVLKVEPALSPGQSILGMTAGEFEKVDLFHWIPESQRPKLMSMIKGQFKSAEESFLVLPNGELEFFIRSEGIRMMKSDKGAEMVEVSFAEMTENERNKQLEKLSQLPRVVHGVIASDAFVGSELDRWQNIKEMLGKRGASSPDGKGIKPEFFVVAKTRKTDPLLRLDAAFFSDIFYRPVERSYFVKKMYLFFSGLEVKDEEKIEIKQFHRHEKIEVGNPIKAVQISEAGLVMTYYRSIHIGSFRKFVLWFPMEVGLPIILGACNFTEEAAEEKGKFNNHFVFYGIRDFYLQHIRIWIRENYVSSKKDE